jgi:catechol 2,3-dioxygenase-like lactoylglutathione lyase family enzyme
MTGLGPDAPATVAGAMDLFHDAALLPRCHVSNRIMQMSAKLECINPILIVRDIKASLDYYVRILGFEKAEWVTEESRFAMVSRDGFGIYLSEHPKEHSKAHVWIGAEDIGPLHEEFMAAGAHIEKPPTNYSWAYEMVVEDPDGHALRIGSDPKQDIPFND